MPIFTIKLTAQTFPSGPELLHKAIFWPDQPQRQVQEYSPEYLTPSQPGRTRPVRPLTMAGSQPKTGSSYRQDRRLNAPPRRLPGP